MKILLRTLIILLAAAVVTGGTLAALQVPAVQSWVSSSQGGEFHGPPAGMTEGEFTVGSTATSATVTAASTDSTASTATGSTATGSTATATTTRPMRGEGGGRSGGNWQGLVEVGKNLGIVIVVSLAIAAAGWVSNRLRPHRPAPAAAA